MTLRVPCCDGGGIRALVYARANLRLSRPFSLDDWQRAKELAKATEAFIKTSEWDETKDWVETSW